MARRSQERSSIEFLLDTSYLLPLVGIEVEEIDRKTYERILRQRIYYPLSMTAELVGVIVKEARRAD